MTNPIESPAASFEDEFLMELICLGDICYISKSKEQPYLEVVDGNETYANLAMECSERFCSLIKDGRRFIEAIDILDQEGFIERYNKIWM